MGIKCFTGGQHTAKNPQATVTLQVVRRGNLNAYLKAAFKVLLHCAVGSEASGVQQYVVGPVKL